MLRVLRANSQLRTLWRNESPITSNYILRINTPKILIDI